MLSARLRHRHLDIAAGRPVRLHEPREPRAVLCGARRSVQADAAGDRVIAGICSPRGAAAEGACSAATVGSTRSEAAACHTASNDVARATGASCASRSVRRSRAAADVRLSAGDARTLARDGDRRGPRGALVPRRGGVVSVRLESASGSRRAGCTLEPGTIVCSRSGARTNRTSRRDRTCRASTCAGACGAVAESSRHSSCSPGPNGARVVGRCRQRAVVSQSVNGRRVEVHTGRRRATSRDDVLLHAGRVAARHHHRASVVSRRSASPACPTPHPRQSERLPHLQPSDDQRRSCRHVEGGAPLTRRPTAP